jgi:uncharacterized membrane protein YfcA
MLSTLISHWRYVWLIVASLLGGALNAMAGGGSFISFPAMLGMGVPPIEANATNTVSLWPGQLVAVATLHGDVRRNLLPVVLNASCLGGFLGAWVLLHTRQRTFLHLIPWLLLLGALIFGASGPVSKWLRARSTQAPPQPHNHIPHVPLFFALLPVCFYVGYFGAGSGLLIMTVLALFGMEKMHELNALKVLAAGAANLCAIFTFIAGGRIIWHLCLIAMIAAALGGYLGARFARRMNPEVMRAVVVITGIIMAGYFFWRQR